VARRRASRRRTWRHRNPDRSLPQLSRRDSRFYRTSLARGRVVAPNRLEVRAAEAGGLKIRLEISERTRSILEEERRRLADDLKRERERTERWEQEFREAQQRVERLTAELGEARQEALQLRAEVEQGKGFFRRRRSGG